MKNFRSLAILMLLALVVAVAPAAFAQDPTFGASEEDIALLTAANENLASTSASFEFTISVQGTGLGNNGGDVTADITGTGVFDTTDPENPLFQLDVTGTADGEPVTLNLRIVDGVAYSNTGDGWEFKPADEVLSDVEEGFGDATGGMGDVDPSSLSPASALDAIAGFEKYISLTRADEGSLAKFTLAIDIPGLLSSPEIGGLILGASGSSTEGMTDAQMTQMTAMIGAMFAEATLSVEEHIDTATETVSGAALNINFPLEAILGSPGAGLVVAVNASVSGYGEPVTVVAPEGAVASSDS